MFPRNMPTLVHSDEPPIYATIHELNGFATALPVPIVGHRNLLICTTLVGQSNKQQYTASSETIVHDRLVSHMGKTSYCTDRYLTRKKNAMCMHLGDNASSASAAIFIQLLLQFSLLILLTERFHRATSLNGRTELRDVMKLPKYSRNFYE
jgi:hypothetical protein